MFSESDLSAIFSNNINFTIISDIDSVLLKLHEIEFDIIVIIDQDITDIAKITATCKQMTFLPVIILASDDKSPKLDNIRTVTKSSLPSIMPFIEETADIAREKRRLLQDLNRLGNFFSQLRSDEYSESRFINEVLMQLNSMLINQYTFKTETIHSFLYQRNLDDLPIVKAANGKFLFLVNQPLPNTFSFSDDPAIFMESQITYLSIPFKWNGENVGGYYIEIPEISNKQLHITDFHTLISSFMGSTGIYDLVSVDTTTRVLTRRFVLQRLYEELKSSYRANHNLTILMMDLDKFKLINDINGHQAGDKILREVGILLHEAARESDIIGRYGGDEFIAILPETEIDGGCVLAHRIREKIRKLGTEHPLGVSGLDISIGICGISSDLLDDTQSGRHRMSHDVFQSALNSLIAIADEAMYQAKISVAEKVKHKEAISWEDSLSG